MADTTAWVDAKLREIHAVEMFGDCVEDGQPFPCKTIQVLNVAAAHSSGCTGEEPSNSNPGV